MCLIPYPGLAWRDQGHFNLELIKKLKSDRMIRTEPVKNAMTQVERGRYISFNPYQEVARDIGYNVITSAPNMHAYILELLQDRLTEGERVLDVGSGSGYLSVCMALMVGKTGCAVGIDHIPELIEFSHNNVMNDKPELIKSGQLKFVVGDGRMGYPEKAPYNAIHIGAAVSALPQALVDQLKPGGRIVVPMGPEGGPYQTLQQYDKKPDGTFSYRNLTGVSIKPLTDKEKQLAVKSTEDDSDVESRIP